MAKMASVGQYLLDQLYSHGVRHIFGVPGDYILGFYELLERSRIKRIGTTREDSAGFAADAYARVQGLGAACVTYCVGGLNMTNPVAGAYAEKSPVIVISGAPPLAQRYRHPLVHHRVRDFSTQREVFSKITVASTALEDPYTAYWEIDRVIHTVERYKRPGYIELPADMVDVTMRHEHRDQSLEEMTDAEALEECIAEVTKMLNQAKRPAILAGVEMHRFGLQDELLKLVEKTRIPVAATVLGKSVIGEAHPLYLGVYEGAMGPKEVRRRIESADCLLMLGCFMTDLNLGIYTAELNPDKTISATSEKMMIRRHSYENIPLRSFVPALLKAKLKRQPQTTVRRPKLAPVGRHRDGERISMRTLFAILESFITDDMVVISDVGSCTFSSVDLTIPHCTKFLCPAYYTSMGFAVPALLGAQTADPSLRPLVLVGDGAFQMTGLELSTAVRMGLNPVVVVLNNHGYTTERTILDGPFNDILNWSYSRLPEMLNSGNGFRARTVGEVKEALKAALADRKKFSIIDVDLEPLDTSPALDRLGERLGKGKRR